MQRLGLVPVILISFLSILLPVSGQSPTSSGPAMQPFLKTIKLGLDPSDGSQGAPLIASFVVPDGKQLVIEFISARVRVKDPLFVMSIEMGIAPTDGSDGGGHTFQMRRDVDVSNTAWMTLDISSKLYVNAAARITFGTGYTGIRPAPDRTIEPVQVTVSGYLVDLSIPTS